MADPITLADFHRRERRRECVVCLLPAEVRAQMAKATDRKIRRATVLAWLAEVHGASVTDEALTAHHSGHHDAA